MAKFNVGLIMALKYILMGIENGSIKAAKDILRELIAQCEEGKKNNKNIDL